MKQTFSKDERLSSYKAIELLFSKGKNFYEHPFKILHQFYPIEDTKAKAQILIVVPKRYFKKAVDRNLLKRRIREVYRKQKREFFTALKDRVTPLSFAVIYTSKTAMSYAEIEQKIVLTLRQLVKKANEIDA